MMALTEQEKLYLKIMAKKSLQDKVDPKPKKKKSLLGEMFSQAKGYGKGASKNYHGSILAKENEKLFKTGGSVSKAVGSATKVGASKVGAKGKKLTKETRDKIKNLDIFLDDYGKAQKKSKKYRDKTKQSSEDFKDSKSQAEGYEEWLKKNQKPDKTKKIKVDIFKESDLDDLEKAQRKSKAKREAMKEESDYKEWLLKNQDIPKLKAPKKPRVKKHRSGMSMKDFKKLQSDRWNSSVNMKYKRK